MFLIVKVAGYFITKKADEFCISIENNYQLEQVRKAAIQKGYKYFEREKESTTKIVVPTQDSPYFRFACVVTFSDGVIVKKSVEAND